MAEKMESFKSGGAYWFTDLSTPDSLYIFPVMTELTCNMQGNPAAATIKNVSRVFAVLTVPFTMSFPKETTFSGDLIALDIYLMMIIFISFIRQAIFCYWITSNLFSLGYGLVLKVPGVKKALGVPEIPKQPVLLHHGLLSICKRLSNKPKPHHSSLPRCPLNQQKLRTK
ncbi:hypothetical protein Gotur_012915 [Gossypium turneri]